MLRTILITATFLLTACGNSSSNYYDGDAKYAENPYSDGTGHFAGYEWAERTGGSCNGNSESFNEGCEEYYYQVGE
jgi:hypothetical protein